MKQTENLSEKFAKYMGEGNVSAALKLLDSANSTGLLHLDKDVMEQLLEKHPSPAPVIGDPLLRGPIEELPSCLFDSIDEDSILNAAK